MKLKYENRHYNGAIFLLIYFAFVLLVTFAFLYF